MMQPKREATKQPSSKPFMEPDQFNLDDFLNNQREANLPAVLEDSFLAANPEETSAVPETYYSSAVKALTLFAVAAMLYLTPCSAPKSNGWLAGSINNPLQNKTNAVRYIRPNQETQKQHLSNQDSEILHTLGNYWMHRRN